MTQERGSFKSWMNSTIRVLGYIGIMAKKMETTIVYYWVTLGYMETLQCNALPSGVG